MLCQNIIITNNVKTMVNLNSFKLSKNQMNSIHGGSTVCDISDYGYNQDKPKGWRNSRGSISFEDLTPAEAEELLYDQIGDEFSIICRSVS